MSSTKIKYQNLNQEVKNEDSEGVFYVDIKEDILAEKIEDLFQQDENTFFLNNLLMSIQFFENYDREIETLRENWYKEFVLYDYRKKCFYADSLFREMQSQVKFRLRHGPNKGKDFLLHPLRIFISNDNMEAAYDPAMFRKSKATLLPFYQLTVRPCDDNKKEKSGYVFLVEFVSLESPQQTDLNRKTAPDDLQTSRKSIYLCKENELFGKNPALNLKRKLTFDLKTSRKLTKTEKVIGLQNKNLSPDKIERRASVRFNLGDSEEPIPNNGFYNYEKPEFRLKIKSIHDVRMNDLPHTPNRIPKKCFQFVEFKKTINSRRENAISENQSCYTTKKVLNSAAFKGYFCELLLERLAEPLSLDLESLNQSFVLEEYVAINQNGVQNNITPVIKIIDWNNHFVLNSSTISNEIQEMEWPTSQMRAIMNILPCYLVPNGYSYQSKENVDYEKEWKLIFPKAEEFLLLHMMHAHLRCYFFVLVIYKTFMESEINPASFGPKHLLHLLFWMVHKDFLSWPEDRPGETLLRFFKILYKKLQNKSLYDFFITTRNLFRESSLKDLHMAQTITKKIIENPVPYVLRAMKNLHFEPDFYPSIDIKQIYNIMKEEKKPKRKKVQKTEKSTVAKTVRWEDDKEREWKVNAIKQINREKKIEKEEELRKLSLDSINVEETIKIDTNEASEHYKILVIFIAHFLKMGNKSAKFKALNQTLGYLHHVQKLFQLLPDKKTTKDLLMEIKDEIINLKKQCEELKSNPPTVKKKTQKVIEETKKVTTKQEKLDENKKNVPVIKIVEREEEEPKPKKEDSDSEDENMSTKL